MKHLTNAFVTGEKSVVIEHGEAKTEFFVRPVGYLAAAHLAGAQARGDNSMALLIAQTVFDKDGNQFTYDEACRLKKEFAEPLLAAALEVSQIGGPEKN